MLHCCWMCKLVWILCTYQTSLIKYQTNNNFLFVLEINMIRSTCITISHDLYLWQCQFSQLLSCVTEFTFNFIGVDTTKSKWLNLLIYFEYETVPFCRHIYVLSFTDRELRLRWAGGLQMTWLCFMCVLQRRKPFLNLRNVVFTVKNLHQHQKEKTQAAQSWPVTVLAVPTKQLHSRCNQTCRQILEEALISYMRGLRCNPLRHI